MSKISYFWQYDGKKTRHCGLRVILLWATFWRAKWSETISAAASQSVIAKITSIKSDFSLMESSLGPSRKNTTHGQKPKHLYLTQTQLLSWNYIQIQRITNSSTRNIPVSIFSSIITKIFNISKIIFRQGNKNAAIIHSKDTNPGLLKVPIIVSTLQFADFLPTQLKLCKFLTQIIWETIFLINN